MSKLIYLDNAATTQVKQEVLDEMLPYLRDNFSNPSAVIVLHKREIVVSRCEYEHNI